MTNKLRVNRRAVNNLKIKGKDWLVENIAHEKKCMEKMGEIDREPYELYVFTMEKALKEIKNEEDQNL
ncbi:MAG: hypothetical protein EBR50_07585 [Proteobacteria bacterium]|nr:hypothetical protein [Pseudomonadota bacterium]